MINKTDFELSEHGKRFLSEHGKRFLSEHGKRFLSDTVMYEALSIIAAEVGATAEEYLFRFESALLNNPEKIYSIFER